MPGSELRESISSACGERLHFKAFKWSGANSHRARESAAQALAWEIEALHAQGNVDDCILIGHSHGGNIAAIAAARVQPRIVLGTACMATPFFSIRERSDVPLRLLLTCIAILALGLSVPALLLIGLYIVENMIPNPMFFLQLVLAISLAIPINFWSGLIAWGIAALYVRSWAPVFLRIWDDRFLSSFRRACEKRRERMVGVTAQAVQNQLVMAYGIDEAYWGLRSASLPVKILLLLVAAMLVLALVLATGYLLFETILSIWELFFSKSNPLPLLGPLFLLSGVCITSGAIGVSIGLVFGLVAAILGLVYGVAVGWVSPMDSVHLRIGVRRRPESSAAGFQYIDLSGLVSSSWWMRKLEGLPLLAGLAHSRIYRDEAALNELSLWINRITNRTAATD